MAGLRECVLCGANFHGPVLRSDRCRANDGGRHVFKDAGSDRAMLPAGASERDVPDQPSGNG